MKHLLLFFLLFLEVQAEESPLVKHLKSLVDLSSGTSQISDVNKVQQFLATQLQALGFTIEWISHPQNKSAPLLIAKRPGKSTKFITFIAHSDTVFERESGFSGLTFSSDRKTAKGPGVIDDKGGLVVALAGLEKYLKNETQPKYSLRVVISPSEETGSEGFTNIFSKFAEDSWLVLGFEPALADGSIIESRRGNRWYNIKVQGREAHSGRDHQAGVNACVELSNHLSEISRLTNYKKGITVSVGHIHGGKDKYNIVCGSAEAKIDLRFLTLIDRDILHSKIEKILNSPKVKAVSDRAQAKTTYEIVDDSPPFSSSIESRALIEKYLSKISEEDKRPKAKRSDGTADSNYFSRPGVIVIDGLGAVGGEMHTIDEFILLSSLKSRSEALAHFLSSL